MKGVIRPDHIPLNRYEMRVTGLPPLVWTTISGIEEELENVDLPDRTAASGGNTKTIEFEATLPLHHTVEQAAMEGWFADSQDNVAVDYKKNAMLIVSSLTGIVVKTLILSGIFPMKRKTGDLDMGNEGELHVVTWSFKGDQVIVT